MFRNSDSGYDGLTSRHRQNMGLAYTQRQCWCRFIGVWLIHNYGTDAGSLLTIVTKLTKMISQ
jgi:hypothetical protein